MDRSTLFNELSLDQLVEVGALCQTGDIELDNHERFELARLIVRRKEVVRELEELVGIHYPPPSSPPLY